MRKQKGIVLNNLIVILIIIFVLIALGINIVIGRTQEDNITQEQNKNQITNETENIQNNDNTENNIEQPIVEKIVYRDRVIIKNVEDETLTDIIIKPEQINQQIEDSENQINTIKPEETKNQINENNQKVEENQNETITIETLKLISATKKTKIIDKNGDIVYIPQSFKIAQDSGETVREGIVIQDEENNQYVWIPVSKNEDGTATHPYKTEDVRTDGEFSDGKEIQLGRYEFDANGTKKTYTGSYVEEDINNNERLLNYANIKALNITEFKNSVSENGGFYFARYEASYGEDKKANSKISTKIRTNKNTQLTEGMLWNFVTQAEATQACRNLYEQSNIITSDLINSYSWDTAIEYIQTYSDSNYSNKTTNNTILQNTGVNSDEKCKINDMASNSREWTTETSNNSKTPCVVRGGIFAFNEYTTSFRDSRNETKEYDGISFRSELYF